MLIAVKDCSRMGFIRGRHEGDFTNDGGNKRLRVHDRSAMPFTVCPRPLKPKTPLAYLRWSWISRTCIGRKNITIVVVQCVGVSAKLKVGETGR